MLAVFASNGPEARRRSAQLLKRGVPHEIFGSPVLGLDDLLFRSPGSGGFFPVPYFDPETCEVSDLLIEKLVEREVTEVVNAGTLESILYSLPLNTGFSIEALMRRKPTISTFPPRREALTLEDTLLEAGIACRSLHDFLSEVGPVAGFDPRIGAGGLSLESVNIVIDRTRERVGAFLRSEAGGGRRGIERVALTVISSNGELSRPSEGNTDACIEEWGNKPKDPTLGPRLLIKIGHAQQSRMDPSAIGHETIHLCRHFGFDGIVLSTDGFIFDREETLLAAAKREAPLPIFGANAVGSQPPAAAPAGDPGKAL